jgi:DNA helicase-2/ATP-dependent DNA helicase PcrA
MNAGILDDSETWEDEVGTGNDEWVDGPSSVIAFEDIFSQDEAHRTRLESIVERVEANEIGPVADFTADADEHQRRFIESPSETIRLLAPAGSGKTQSVVNRVLSQAARGQSLDRFLILTFDNAAGLSLREKLETGIAASGLKFRGAAAVQTLNKFGYRLLRGILRDKVGRCEVGANVEMDRHESIRRALEQLRARYPQVHALLPAKLARRVYLDLISTLKNEVIVADRLLKKDRASVNALLDLAEQTGLFEPWLEPHRGTAGWDEAKRKIPGVLVYVYKLYDDINRNHRRIDFDDQKLLAYLGLAADDGLAEIATAQFTTVIVDEFQDINRLDFEFIRLLARGKQLIVVGDDDQAIYAFRRCSPDYIINFPLRIGRSVESHVLRTNYRCPRNVVEMGNRLIAHNANRIEKNQIAHRSDEADVHLWHCLNSASEAQVVARFIKKLHSERSAKGFHYSDVAVLLRMNSQSLPLQIALILEEIPYHCRREDNVIVSDLMKKLLGLIDLHARLREDANALSFADSRLLCNCLLRYVSPRDVDRFHRDVERAGGYLQLARNPDRASLPGRLSAADFRRAVQNLAKPASPLELVQRISAGFKHLGGMIGSLEDALNNTLPLGELVDIAGRFKGDVGQFHDMLTGLLAKVEGGLYHGEDGDAVNLLTYFRAKGRQWNTVIIPGANQKVIPHSNAHVDDERRLFYVAITRATSNLIVSFVRHAVRSKVEPSQFITEMGLAVAEEKRAKVIA